MPHPLDIPRNLSDLDKADALGFLRATLQDFGFTAQQADSLSRWVWGQITDGRPPERVSLELPQRKEFRERFPAIHQMQERGLTPPTAAQIVQFEQDVQGIVSTFGLPTEDFANTETITNLLLGQVSPNELNARLTTLSNEILGGDRAEQIRQFYANNYGITGLSDGAILASAFTTGTPPHVFEQRIRAAQVGGTAARFGFDRSREEAERLASFGLDLPGARELFSEAQTRVPMLERLRQRHLDPTDPFDIEAFERAIVFRDPTERRRIGRLLAAEESLFTQQALFQRGQDGGVVGIRQS